MLSNAISSHNRIKIPVISSGHLAIIFCTKWLGISNHDRVLRALRVKNETQMFGNDQAERQIARRADLLPAGQISDLFKLAPEYLGAHKENEWDCGGRRNAQGCFRGS